MNLFLNLDLRMSIYSNSTINSIYNFYYSLTPERMEEMVDFVTQEPQFSDSPQRCFKLPFVATEALCTDNEHIQNAVLGTQ